MKKQLILAALIIAALTSSVGLMGSVQRIHSNDTVEVGPDGHVDSDRAQPWEVGEPGRGRGEY